MEKFFPCPSCRFVRRHQQVPESHPALSVRNTESMPRLSRGNDSTRTRRCWAKAAPGQEAAEVACSMQRELKILVLWLEGLRTLSEAKQLPREVPTLKSKLPRQTLPSVPCGIGGTVKLKISTRSHVLTKRTHAGSVLCTRGLPSPEKLLPFAQPGPGISLQHKALSFASQSWLFPGDLTYLCL